MPRCFECVVDSLLPSAVCALVGRPCSQGPIPVVGSEGGVAKISNVVVCVCLGYQTIN